MGRAPCCDKANVKKGPWSPEEDAKLKDYIDQNGTGSNWISLPHKAGLKRCGKSCRLRWLNYLRPNIKHGEFSDEEDKIICSLYANIGSRWSIIAAQLPGRTDNDIKNYWNTKLKKKLMGLHSLPNSSSSHHHHGKLPFHHPQHQLTNYTSLLQSSPLANSAHQISNNYGLVSTNSFNSCAMQRHYQQQVINDAVLAFGTGGGSTTEPSCSSSDGSSNNIGAVRQQQHRVKEFDYDAEQLQMSSFHEQQVLQGSGANGHDYGTASFCNQDGTWSVDDQIVKGSVLEDYGLEEIRQLVSTGGGGDDDSSGLLLFDDNRTEERIMFY